MNHGEDKKFSSRKLTILVTEFVNMGGSVKWLMIRRWGSLRKLGIVIYQTVLNKRYRSLFIFSPLITLILF